MSIRIDRLDVCKHTGEGLSIILDMFWIVLCVSRRSILFPPGWLVGEHHDRYVDRYVVSEHTGVGLGIKISIFC